MRLPKADLRRDHQSVHGPAQVGKTHHHPAQPAIEIRAHAHGDPGLMDRPQGRGDIRKTLPRFGPAEVVPELGESSLRVWYFRQDLGDDPAPPPDLGPLVGGVNTSLSPDLIALE